MKNLLLLITITITITSFSVSADKANDQKRVAILISGYGNQGAPNLSYDLEELAQSYLILHDNGLKIDIISPEGGPVIVKRNKDELTHIKRFKNETDALQQLKNTVSAKQATTINYDSLFIVGGDGAMFDLPTHLGTQQLIQIFIQKDSPIAAVCHGPAALVNLKTADGNFYVKDKIINAFTLREDKAFKKEHIDKYPFILQPELERRGAIFKSNRPMLPYVVEHGNLITAQNPMSVPSATEALLLKMSIKPKVRVPFKDEATMSLISQAHQQGSVIIDLALASHPDSYDMNYLALYGFYAFGIAKSESDKATELEIMERIGKHFSHPQYQIAFIRALVEQGHKLRAIEQYKLFKNTFSETPFPKELLAKVNK